MVRRKEAQASALIITVVVLLLYFLKIPPDLVGLSSVSGFYTRFTYQFFHASLLHAAINCWALLSVVFIYDVSWRMILTGYIVSALFPISLLGTSIPTIGLSGLIYFLFGRISLSVVRKVYFQGWMFFFIGVGFSFATTNAWMHLFCYVIGVFIAFLNKSIYR